MNENTIPAELTLDPTDWNAFRVLAHHSREADFIALVDAVVEIGRDVIRTVIVPERA